MSWEEEAILWRSLEKIPDLYREPLILFYRERQSIAHVAETLELTTWLHGRKVRLFSSAACSRASWGTR